MKRQSKSLGCSLERRLNAYALAASAAGVVLPLPSDLIIPAGAALAMAFALSQPAEARIVYTRTYKPILCDQRGTRTYMLCRGTVPIDLDNNNRRDFVLACTSGERWGGLGVSATRKKSGIISHTGYAAALSEGAVIGSGEDFKTDGVMVSVNSTGSRFSYGPWANVRGRYLGLKIAIRGKVHYGWARVRTHADPWKSRRYGTLTGYAYETIPNKPIIAGKTKGPDVITLRPASLGHLARGASAIPAWRGNGQ